MRSIVAPTSTANRKETSVSACHRFPARLRCKLAMGFAFRTAENRLASER